MKQSIKIILNLFCLFLLAIPAYSEEKKENSNEHELNFYTGMFDFSDDKQASGVLGLQHQNDELFRESFLGTLQPVTGAMITADNASYFYTGVQAEYSIGFLNLTPSFAPGYYNQGDGKDLGRTPGLS